MCRPTVAEVPAAQFPHTDGAMDTWTSQLVLVVADTEIRATYCDWLLAGGFEVAEAVDGADAMTATVADLPDLVLADARLSGPVTLVDLCMYLDAKGVKVIVADSAADNSDPPGPGCDMPILTRPTARTVCEEVRRVLDHLAASPVDDDKTGRSGVTTADVPASAEAVDLPSGAPVPRPGKS